VKVRTLREALELFVERRCGMIEAHPSIQELALLVGRRRGRRPARLTWAYREHLVCCRACGDIVLRLNQRRL